MTDAPAPAHSAFRRGWKRFVYYVFFVWLVMFLIVLLHVDFPVLDVVPEAQVSWARFVLVWLLPIFAMNLILRYRWSGLPFHKFARKNWLDFLMIIPIARVLRLFAIFRFGKLALLLKEYGRGRKVFSLSRKLFKRARRAMRARAALGAATIAGGAAAAATAVTAAEAPPAAAPSAPPAPPPEPSGRP